LIFSLILSQALFKSSPSLRFSKAVNLFIISILYFFLTFSLFSFLWLSLFQSKFCAACLLTPIHSLTFATFIYQPVSQSAPLKLRTSSTLKCHLLSINMRSIRLWVFPLWEVRVYLWKFWCGNIMILTTRFLMQQSLIF
jgi:hypothetical protein